MDPDHEKCVLEFLNSVRDLSSVTIPLVECKKIDYDALSASTRARLEALKAYTTVVVFFSYLSARNIPPDESFVKAMTTVREYLARAYEAETAPRMKLNPDAVKRLTKAHIPR